MAAFLSSFKRLPSLLLLLAVACVEPAAPSHLQLVVLRGSPYERGLEHGRQLGPRIRSLYTTLLANSLLPYLDRVVYIAGGRVLAGRPEDVITGETLSGLYRTPIEVLRTSDGRLVVVGQPEAPAHHSDRHEHS